MDQWRGGDSSLKHFDVIISVAVTVSKSNCKSLVQINQDAKTQHRQRWLAWSGCCYRSIHPLTGTTSSGGGGSGGMEPKCFSSFIRCVRFMMVFCWKTDSSRFSLTEKTPDGSVLGGKWSSVPQPHWSRSRRPQQTKNPQKESTATGGVNWRGRKR